MASKRTLTLVGVAVLIAFAAFADLNYNLQTPNSASLLLRATPVSGAVYINYYKHPIHVSGTVTNVAASVNGTSRFELRVFQQGGSANPNGITNFCGGTTTNTLPQTTNMYVLEAWVPTGFAWTWTNQNAGAGNAAGPATGQVYVPAQ